MNPQPMADEDKKSRYNSSRYRSRSRSRSRERDRERSYKHRDRRKLHNDETLHKSHKRHRSRSRDTPRKRRSLSPGHERDMSWRSKKHLRPEREHHGEERNRRRSSLDPKQSNDRSRDSPQRYNRSKAPLPSQNDAFQKEEALISGQSLPPEKEKANFGNTGRLAAASNSVQAGKETIILKYHEPMEARKPSAKDRWRMYVFKGDEILDTVELCEQSCWLFGREAAVADFPIDHPSCSKQHAVIQFRFVEKKNEFGDKTGRVRPYIIDLESANGTMVNDDKIPDGRYVELRDKDVIRFGHSTREYVVQLPA